MAKKLQPPVDNDRVQKAKTIQNTKESRLAPDGLPYVYTNIELELKKRPHMFDLFESGKVDYSERADSVSKTEAEMVYQWTLWKTYKYLMAQDKDTILIGANGENDKVKRGFASINGVEFYVWKKMYLLVPKDVAKLFRDSQQETEDAGEAEKVQNISSKIDPETNLPKDPERLQR